MSKLGEHVNIWDPQFIYATVEANNFKFGIQLGLLLFTIRGE